MNVTHLSSAELVSELLAAPVRQAPLPLPCACACDAAAPYQAFDHAPPELAHKLSVARELLLRVPGFGVQTVDRLLAARRVRRLRHADLARLHVPLKKVLPFVEAADYRPGRALEAADLAAHLAPPPVQRSLF